MFLFVATPCHILGFDTETMEVHQIEKREFNSFYGISWFPNSEEIVYSDSLYDPTQLTSPERYLESKCGIIRVGEQTHDLSLSATHQILCTNDGNVLCVNTGNNSIIIYNPKTRKICKEISISGLRLDRFDPSGDLGDHLNSIHIHADKLFVLAHGHTRFSKLGIFSYPGLKLEEVRVLKNRTGLHNLFVNEKNELVSCNSAASSLVDLNTDKDLWFAPSSTHGYLKGLAVANEFMFVGGSRFADRDLRVQSETTIWVIDRENFKTLSHYNLGDFGPVQDLRISSHEDKAHNASTHNGIYEELFTSGKQVNYANHLEFYGKSSSPIGNLNICRDFTRYRGMGIFDFDGKLNTEVFPEIWIAKNLPKSSELEISLPQVDIQYRFTSTQSTCFLLLSTDMPDRLEKYYLVGVVSDKNSAVELWEVNGKENSIIASLAIGAPEFGVLSLHMSEQDIVVKVSNTEMSYSDEWSIKDLVKFDTVVAEKIGFLISNTSIDSVNLTWNIVDSTQKPKESKSKEYSKSKREIVNIKKLKQAVNPKAKEKTK